MVEWVVVLFVKCKDDRESNLDKGSWRTGIVLADISSDEAVLVGLCL